MNQAKQWCIDMHLLWLALPYLIGNGFAGNLVLLLDDAKVKRV